MSERRKAARGATSASPIRIARSSGAPLRSCSISDGFLANYDMQSACNGGDAYQCHGLVPWAASDTLAYGYAATSSGDT